MARETANKGGGRRAQRAHRDIGVNALALIEHILNSIDPGLITILTAYAISVPGGWLVTGSMLWIMRKSIV